MLVDSMSSKEDSLANTRSAGKWFSSLTLQGVIKLGNESLLYLEPHCMDGVRSQDESDVDCGGETCPKCKIGKHCNEDCDCSTNTCNNGKCAGKLLIDTDLLHCIALQCIEELFRIRIVR